MPACVAVTSVVGSGDGTPVGTAALPGVRDASVREFAVGSDGAASDDAVGVGVGVGHADRGDDADGLGIADGAGGVAGPLAGGGARGGAGDVGASEVPAWSGSATSTATAQATPAPIAVRTSRRRDALRRIDS
ncbi:hypothetical protein AB5J49_24735 [Streptomyces sp. R28]|uniref:Uncharacterized protein n=1 Tax=Streptomyces sp. R28 TaxID=3238628 RepID=A0AB39Q1C9_9ACTN